jgi:hypothetical protein
MSDQTVAKTILEQLGGRKFIVMTGARNLIGASGNLSFRLPGAGGFCNDGINHVVITLTPNDEYDMTFSRLRGMKVTQVAKYEGVYFDQLQELFTKATGLATSLGTMGAK